MNEESRENRHAIEIMMELYNISEEEAHELWSRFLITVTKMKKVTEKPPMSSDEE